MRNSYWSSDVCSSDRRLKRKAVEIPVHPRDGIDLDVLEQTLERHPIKACWCMTSFQNPMGATMPEERKQALVELLRRHQVPLIEDDVYAELYSGQQAPKPAKAIDTEGMRGEGRRGGKGGVRTRR